MFITSWTTDRLCTDGNDVRVEWADGAHRASVFVDDTEVEVLAIGIGWRTQTGAAQIARRYLERVENYGTQAMLDRLDAAIERAHEAKLDELYAEGGDDL